MTQPTSPSPKRLALSCIPVTENSRKAIEHKPDQAEFHFNLTAFPNGSHDNPHDNSLFPMGSLAMTIIIVIINVAIIITITIIITTIGM